MKHKKHWILLLLGVIFILGSLFFITQNSSVLADSGFDADWGGGSSSSGGSSWGGSSGGSWGSSSSSSSGGSFDAAASVANLSEFFDQIFAKYNLVEGVLLIVILFILLIFREFGFLLIFTIIFTMVHKTINRIIKYAQYKKDVFKLKQSKKDSIVINEKAFLLSAFEIYKTIQIARMNFDYETLQKYTTKELFEKTKTQLNKLDEKKQQNIVENIQYQNSSIVEKSETGNGIQKGTVTLTITCKDYLIDQNTKKILHGEKEKTVLYTYKLTFIKEEKCPKCGVPLTNNQHTCENCGSVLKETKLGFVLCKKEIMNERILNDGEGK